MILDAPLKLPQRCSYTIFGDTAICRRLQEILSVVRPGASFLGYRSNASDRSSDYLIVVDLLVPGAAGLLDQKEHPGVAVFPVPIGDYWSYWEFSEFALGHLEVDGEVTGKVSVSDQDMAEILTRMGRIVVDQDTGAASVPDIHYLSMQKNEISENMDKIMEVSEGLSDKASLDRFTLLLTSAPQVHWQRYVERTFSNIQYFDYIDFSRWRRDGSQC